MVLRIRSRPFRGFGEQIDSVDLDRFEFPSANGFKNPDAGRVNGSS